MFTGFAGVVGFARIAGPTGFTGGVKLATGVRARRKRGRIILAVSAPLAVAGKAPEPAVVEGSTRAASRGTDARLTVVPEEGIRQRASLPVDGRP